MRYLAILMILSGNISPVGTTIEVENYKCVVVSARSIECTNVGRVCASARAKEQEFHDKYFGCRLDEWKLKHPGEKCPDDFFHSPRECWPMTFGWGQ
jgi:hypothetical protein